MAGSIVQHPTQPQSTATTSTALTVANPALGNVLLAWANSDGTQTVPTDNGTGAVWTLRASVVDGNGCYLWTKQVAAGDTTMTTVTFGGVSARRLVGMVEIAGVAAAAYDVSNTGTVQTGGSFTSTSTVSNTTTGASGDFVLHFAMLHSVTVTTLPTSPSWTNGFTLLDNVGQLTTNSETTLIGTLNQGTAAAISSVASWTGAWSDANSLIISFKLATPTSGDSARFPSTPPGFLSPAAFLWQNPSLFTSGSPPSSVTLTQTITASVTPTPTTAVRVGLTKTGAVSTAPSVLRALGLTRAATVVTTSTFLRSLGRSVSSAVTTTASAVGFRSLNRAVTATVATSTNTIRALTRTVTAPVSTSVSYVRQVGRTTRATVVSSVASVRSLGVTKAAVVATTPNYVRALSRALSAAVSTTANAVSTRVQLLTITATVGTTASATRQVGKSVSAAVGTSASYLRQLGKAVAATASTTVAYVRQLGVTRAASVLPTPATKKQIGKTVKVTVGTLAVGTPVITRGTAFDGSVVAWIPFIPDEVAIGQLFSLKVVFAAADGTRPALDAAPLARVFDATDAVVAGPTSMTAAGDGWTLTYTPTGQGPQALEVRALLSGVTQFYTHGFTVRPQFDPIALALSDVLVSRM